MLTTWGQCVEGTAILIPPRALATAMLALTLITSTPVIQQVGVKKYFMIKGRVFVITMYMGIMTEMGVDAMLPLANCLHFPHLLYSM